MNKLEALQYVCSNFHGYDGGFQFACLRDVITEEVNEYSQEDLNLLIVEMEKY